MRQFMVKGIPDEILDAARIDGSSEFALFVRIALPLARPAIGALTIFTFLESWNSFLWPLIVLRSETTYTLPIGLQNLVANQHSEWGQVMAAATLVAIPMVVLFVSMQRYFIAGLTVGAVKG